MLSFLFVEKGKLFIKKREGEGLTFFNKNNRANFSGELKKENEAFRSVYFLRVREQTSG